MSVSNWWYGDPPRAGYYLAAWLRGKDGAPTVSELWFNPNTGWFTTRGYIDDVGGISIQGIYAYRQKPPAPPFSL